MFLKKVLFFIFILIFTFTMVSCGDSKAKTQHDEDKIADTDTVVDSNESDEMQDKVDEIQDLIDSDEIEDVIDEIQDLTENDEVQDVVDEIQDLIDNDEVQDAVDEIQDLNDSDEISDEDVENCKDKVEICNYKDDNCNDKIDEPFTDSTGKYYILNEHCGECNKKCFNNNTISNNCAKSGKFIGICQPVCKMGFFNLDHDGYNGCEIGCEFTKFKGTDENFIKIAGGESSNDIYGDNFDSTLENDKINTVVFLKRVGKYSDIFMKKYNLDGKLLLDEKKITSFAAMKSISNIHIAYANNHYFLFYIKNYSSFLQILDENGNKISGQTETELVDSTKFQVYDIAITKKADSSNLIYVYWNQVAKSGSVKNIAFKSLNTKTLQISKTNTINTSDTLLTNLKAASTSTTQGLVGCSTTLSSTSKITLFAMRNNAGIYLSPSLDIASYKGSTCKNHTYNIAPSLSLSSGFWIVKDTGTLDKKLYLEKYYLGKTKITKDSTVKTINYPALSTKVLATSLFFNESANVYLLASAFLHSKGSSYVTDSFYQRFNTSLNSLTDSVKFQTIEATNDADRVLKLNAVYTNSKKVIINSLTRHPEESNNREVDFSATKTCIH